MTDREDAIERVRRAAARLVSATEERDAAMRERDDSLRAAQVAGATYDVLEEAAGISRVTISKALRRT